MQTIQEQWLEFASQCVPAHASPNERKERRRMFFSGYWAALNSQVKLAELPDDLAIQHLSSWHTEAEQFFEDVKKGEA